MVQSKRYVTLRDVAQRANCSTAVVSTVINNARGNTQVSEETRQRVMQASRDLSYRPNFASRSLVSRRSRTLGIYIPPAPWTGPGYGYDNSILKGIEAGCRAHGYDLLLINLAGQMTAEACFDKFAERRIDGLLVVHAEPDCTELLDLVRGSPNVVLVDYPIADPQMNLVLFDNRAASSAAVDHLVGLGHRRIGFVGSCRQPPNIDGDIREEAFIHAMRDRELELKKEWVFNRHLLQQPIRPDDAVCQIEARLWVQHIAQLGKHGPTAWITYTDFVAANALPHLVAAGIRVPEDISLMGVDDSPWCSMVTPALTAMRHPLEAMGRRGVDLLISMTEKTRGDSPQSGIHALYPPSLVVRQSTAAL